MTPMNVVTRSKYHIGDLVSLPARQDGPRRRGVLTVSELLHESGELMVVDRHGAAWRVDEAAVVPATVEDALRYTTEDLLFLENAHREAVLAKQQRLELLERYFRDGEQAKDLLRGAGYGVAGTSLLQTVRECLADILLRATPYP